jgi:hypothetical protein
MNKFDLCADTVTLDYAQLVKLSQIAIRYTRDELQRQLARWNIDLPVSPVFVESMKNAADSLAEASVANYYLMNGLDRKEVIIKKERDSEQK